MFPYFFVQNSPSTFVHPAVSHTFNQEELWKRSFHRVTRTSFEYEELWKLYSIKRNGHAQCKLLPRCSTVKNWNSHVSFHIDVPFRFTFEKNRCFVNVYEELLLEHRTWNVDTIRFLKSFITGSIWQFHFWPKRVLIHVTRIFRCVNSCSQKTSFFSFPDLNHFLDRRAPLCRLPHW